MYVITASQMASLEKKAIKEGADSEEFMIKASNGIANIISNFIRSHSKEKKITLIAGVGNNAGDGYCASSILLENHFEVEAYQLGPLDDCSPLCQKYAKKFKEKGGVIHLIQSSAEMMLPQEGVLLDGIFGTGFKGETDPFISGVIRRVNQTQVPVFSIDIPSGLEGDTGLVRKSAIEADYTLFLGLPKRGFFIEDGWDHVGQLIHVDFGIHPKYFEKEKPEFDMLTNKEACQLVPKIKRSRHKYEAGFVAGFSGSKGMMGASILSGVGALRAGAGIVKVIHFEDEFSDVSSYPELIHHTFNYEDQEKIYSYIEKATSIFLGPGMGLKKEAAHFMKNLFKDIEKPFVIDADALTLLAEHKIDPPKKAILTPHRGEAKRLLNLSDESQSALLKACQKYVDEKEVILILKGGPTFIFAKNQIPIVNVTGDPGMATAGSGDVLTGMIAALLSEKLFPISAAKLGVFLHGKAGEYAALKKTSYALTATDILKAIHKSWIYLLNKKCSQ